MQDNPYKTAMDGIAYKVAIQSIRKVIRESGTNDVAKVNIIMSIIHDLEKDIEKKLLDLRKDLEKERKEDHV